MLEIIKYLNENPTAYFGLLLFIFVILWEIKEIVNAAHNPYKVSYTKNIIVDKNIKKESDENESK